MKLRDVMQERAVPAARAPRNVQLGLGLPPETMARLDRLRACTGMTRGQVVDLALTQAGLSDLERVWSAKIGRFEALAGRAQMTWQQYAADYARRWSTKTYPPTVEDLEKAEVAQAALSG